MNQIILVSTGLSSVAAKESLTRIFPNLKNKNAVLITTASEGKESNKWNILTKEQFLELGYEKVDFLDLEENPNVDLSEYQTIFVCGGTTFKLMKYVGQSNFKEEVIKCLNRGGIYIGSSAGALIATPTIQIAGEVVPDDNAVNLINLEGMGLVNFEILPHYEPSMDEEIEEYKKKTSREIKIITNDEIVEVQFLNTN